MNKENIKQALYIAEHANCFEQLKTSISILCNELLSDMESNLNLDENVYVRDDVDINSIFYWATEYEDRYEVRSMLDEFLIIYKDTRQIYQYGYNGVVLNWWNKGYLIQ